MRALGLDLGGSSVKLVRLDAGRATLVARVSHGRHDLVAAAVEAARRLEAGDAALPLGVAVAGLVRDGRVTSGNLGLADAPLREELERALGRSVAAFVSDAHAAGRAAQGEAGRERLVLALALGTGVGGALLFDGEIVRDEGLGHGVEIPRALGDPPGPCAIGHARCLEAYLGARALVAAARDAGIVVDSAEGLEAAARTIVGARLVLERAGRVLAAGARLGASLSPPRRPARGLSPSPGEPWCLVLSGGVAGSGTIQNAAAKQLEAEMGRICVSRFGPLTGGAGAALEALLVHS